MTTADTLEHDLKQLIIEVGQLEDLKPEDIASDMPLFKDGLGLDSIDALELGMSVAQKYGIQLGRDSDENTKHFQSVNTLARLIREHPGVAAKAKI